MKTSLKLAALALLSSFILHPACLLAQGNLTPPGAPAATMRTLDQIYGRTDARIPIANSTSAVTISQPGSYYLTTNLTVSVGAGIIIATNGVTLDLNGYTIRSTAASADNVAILLNGGLRNITIGNGFIESGVTNNAGTYSGSGFGRGIDYLNPAPANVLVSRVSVAGCLSHGIYLGLGDSTVVEGCTVRTAGGIGVYASTIKTSSAIDCGSIAIYGHQVSDCRGESSISFGVFAVTALNCYGSSNSGIGVDATTALNCYGFTAGNSIGVSANTAQNCLGSSISGYGVSANTAQNCLGSSNSGYGVYASWLATGCVGNNLSGTGLYAWLANGCVGRSSTGTALSATHNINSFAY